MSKLKKIMLIFMLASTVSCTSASYYAKQDKVNQYIQTGMQYYWEGGDIKKAEKDVFKGITLGGKYDLVEKAFKYASDNEPNNLNLRFGIAAAQLSQKKFNQVLDTYKKIIDIYPNSFNANILLAGYSRALGDMNEYNKVISKLIKIYPERTKKYEQAFNRMDDIFNLEMTDKAFKVNDNNHVIVTLGYALNKDGTMAPTLIHRLEQTLAMAKLNPNSKIIVTGGVPRQGVTESYLMKKWLVEHGINKDRIIAEDRAKDTVGNAYFTSLILKELGAKSVTLITSASHIRRGVVTLDEAARLAGMNIKLSNLVYLDSSSLEEAKKPNPNEKIFIYRDGIRSTGIWLFPGLQR